MHLGAAAIVWVADDHRGRPRRGGANIPEPCSTHYPNAGAGYYGLSELRANYLTRDDVAQMRQRLAAGVPNQGQPPEHGLRAGPNAGRHGRI